MSKYEPNETHPSQIVRSEEHPRVSTLRFTHSLNSEDVYTGWECGEFDYAGVLSSYEIGEDPFRSLST